jgi:hypothetical protein
MRVIYSLQQLIYLMYNWDKLDYVDHANTETIGTYNTLQPYTFAYTRVRISPYVQHLKCMVK